jgi:hypothetical protein
MLEVRRTEAVTADAAFQTQQSIVIALHSAYNKLEQALAPQPRQSSSRSSTKRPAAAAKKSSGKKRAVATPTPTADPNAHCQKQFPGGIVCDEPVDANVHQLRGATGYHEFVATSQPATSNGEASTTETKPDAVGVIPAGLAGSSKVLV